MGVDLFFVLSGFLVSGLLFSDYKKHGKVRIGRFLLRRGFKIYPAFWVQLTFWIGFLYVTASPLLRKRNLVGEILFLQNYIGRLQPITWSLAVEEHFYLLLALVIWLALRRQLRRGLTTEQPFRFIPTLFVIVAIGCFASRLAAALWFGHFNGKLMLFDTHARIDSLFAGVLLSYYLHFRWTADVLARLKRFRWWLLAAGAACLIPAFIWDFEKYLWVSVVGFSLFAFGGVLLVTGAVLAATDKPGWLLRLCAYGGSHSYSVYLWHFSVVTLLDSAFTKAGANWWLVWWCYFLGAWVIGIVMANLVEFPVLRLRDRFLGNSQSPILATSGGIT